MCIALHSLYGADVPLKMAYSVTVRRYYFFSVSNNQFAHNVIYEQWCHQSAEVEGKV